MDEDSKRDADQDAAVVDWTASPDAESDGWDEAVDGWSAPGVEEDVEVDAEPAPAPREPASREARRKGPVAEQPVAQAAAAPKPAPRRSPLAVLAFVALAGYLGWIAVLCHRDLGALHARAEGASDEQIAALQRDHAAVTHMLLFNVAAAAPFLLGAVLYLAGKRRPAQFFGLVGIALVIYLLHWMLGPGSAYLRETDLLVRTVLLVVAAWLA